ncbi:MAG: hypothetical protein JXA94_03605 [Parachlamydiales bacterium]|nr:hypothetical protein [Parachlamydiales bacterium]
MQNTGDIVAIGRIENQRFKNTVRASIATISTIGVAYYAYSNYDKIHGVISGCLWKINSADNECLKFFSERQFAILKSSVNCTLDGFTKLNKALDYIEWLAKLPIMLVLKVLENALG